MFGVEHDFHMKLFVAEEDQRPMMRTMFGMMVVASVLVLAVFMLPVFVIVILVFLRRSGSPRP